MNFQRGDVVIPRDACYPSGALIVDSIDASGALTAYPLEGGLQRRIGAEQAAKLRLVDEAERARAANQFQPGFFRLADTEESFEGWSDGELWEGWSMPRFEAAVCENIIRAMGDANSYYDKSSDSFITIDKNEDLHAWSAELITTASGSQLKVYPLGGGQWMWESVDR